MDRNIKSRFFIATMCGRWQQIASEYGVAIELDQYCQAENMDGEKGKKVEAIIRKSLEKYEGRVLHAPFNELFPAAIDPKARQLAMDRFQKAADLAMSYGIKKMVVHSGYIPFVYFKEWHIPRSVEFWTEFMADKPDDFEIAIENVLDDEPDMLAAIARDANDPRIGLCYDVGHSNIISDVGQDQWLETMAPYLKHLHIHNNDGERDYHRALMDGNLDIERLLDGVIEKCAPTTTVTAEILADGGSFDWLKGKGYL